MNRHPLSAAFPDMSPDEFTGLVADIKANGLRDSGWVYDGMIIDGWHRSEACKEAGVPFRYDTYKGSDAVAFVLSRNAHRRHLTASQRAAAVVACHAWRKRGEKSNGQSLPITATTAEMAKEANVGERTIKQAKAAQEAGLGEAVRDGALSAEQAEAIATGRADKAPKTDPKARRISELESEVEALKDEMEQVREGAAEAVMAAEAARALLNTEPGKVLLTYKAEIARLTRDRDDYQNKCGQMVKQIRVLERKLAKYEVSA